MPQTTEPKTITLTRDEVLLLLPVMQAAETGLSKEEFKLLDILQAKLEEWVNE